MAARLCWCIHFSLMLVAAGLIAILNGDTVPASLPRKGYKINQHPHKGLEIPGLFINTVGFVSFLKVDLSVF